MMSLANYIDSLQKTKTFQVGLISIQEYSFQKGLFGMKLPSIPHADDDRHVVVMEIRGDRPNIFTVLRDPKQSIQITTKDVDKLLFIFVEMRPQTLVIESPIDGYKLCDGHRIDVKFTVKYQVKDAKVFWSSNKDPLTEFEITIINSAKNFFLNLSSNSLISNPSDIKQSLELNIHESKISEIKNNLEFSIGKTPPITGINLELVIADISIGDSLEKHLETIRNMLYGKGGILERKKIDQIINADTTFSPYNLREVINAIDIRLLEDFYSLSWSEAMRKVSEKVTEKKQEYMISVEQKEINKMQNVKNVADVLELDKMDKDSIKSKLADKLMAMIDKDANTNSLSDSAYLERIIPFSSGHLLESEARKPE
nr:hypothetical protein [Desulfobacula sp.]